MTDNILFPATIMPDKDWWNALWPDPGAVIRAVGISPNMQVVNLSIVLKAVRHQFVLELWA